MGVITLQHLDDSELTEEELDYWRPHIRDSISREYLDRLKELIAKGESSKKDPERWNTLKEAAWLETISTNEVCKAVSAISAQRRAERAAMQGWAPVPAWAEESQNDSPAEAPGDIGTLPTHLRALRATACRVH
jgi:hypothetical protein